MGKRKVFKETDLSIPEVEHILDHEKHVILLQELIPPTTTRIEFGRNATRIRTFDFAHWYGVSINSITFACHRQIERFQAGQDAEVEISTVTGYCSSLRYFLDYLMFRAAAFGCEITLADINREVIDGYIDFLRGRGSSVQSCRTHYMQTKSVMVALGRRGLIKVTTSGDDTTFPPNPYRNNKQPCKGETSLSKIERQNFAAAIKSAVMPIWEDDVVLTGELLSYALLIVALHTGRNATPLIEMKPDCLRAHPKDGSTFLILWKRRGHNTSKVTLRKTSTHTPLLEFTPTIKTNVEKLIRRVIFLTEALRASSDIDLQDRVWLFESRSHAHDPCHISALGENTIGRAIQKLVKSYNLIDSNGQPLRINISRLRKTFANRIFELLDGDMATTALALGNSPQVAGRNYLMPDDNAKRNWRFMGEILVKELLNKTIGATYHGTPLGRCSDPVNGQYAPKRAGATCINFLNCIRCKHYTITGEDLYKLFSFYFRVLSERTRIGLRRWRRHYAYIPRLIDDYIVAEGIKRGVFKHSAVEDARKHARAQPHPFWSIDQLSDLGLFA